jgi:hypothetical protein
MRGVLILLASFLSFVLQAQTQDSYEYQREFTWGINKNTSGGLIGGLTFKKARKLKNDRILETYGLEVVNIKHPQEVRKSAIYGNLFIPGKRNYLYALRFQYGRDLILFKKAPQQGVEIKAVFAAGPSLGIVNPYYVEYARTADQVTSFAQYSKEISIVDIYGPGRLFQGLGQSTLVLGANLKAAVNFELGTVKSQVTGFETGFLLDAYSKEIELMIDAKRYALYPTLFITLFYGNRR